MHTLGMEGYIKERAMKEFNPNLAEQRNRDGKCGLCGKKLIGAGVLVYTDGSEVSPDAAVFEGMGYAEVYVGSECAKKKVI